MAEKDNKKRLLYILDMMKKTDENHPLNSTQIIEKLAEKGIKAERKAVSRDVKFLGEFDFLKYTIHTCNNHNLGWYMIDQEFEDYEIKMLVDAVASAKFLTLEGSRNLIKKIKNLATIEGEHLIEETMIMDPELKIDDKKFNIKFDTIMRAITDHKQLRFRYYEMTAGNKKVLKRDGYMYQVSPYFIVLSGEEYFLIANPSTHNHVTYFRIEMITNMEVCDERVRPMREIEELKDINQSRTIADYLRENVSMWNGETASVTLRGKNSLRNDVMRKFGRNIMIRDEGKEEFIAHVRVANSEGFYYWLASYGPYITIEGPNDMRQGYIEFLKNSLKRYE